MKKLSYNEKGIVAGGATYVCSGGKSKCYRRVPVGDGTYTRSWYCCYK